MFHQSAWTKGTGRKAVAIMALAMVAAGCNDDKPGAAVPNSTSSGASTAAAAPPPASPPSANADADDDGPPAADAKTFDCGAKGQKLCPMQKWMKTVMAGASSSGDGQRLAEALTYVEKHAPPGYETWSALAADGAKKAKADDLDGAKVSCKQCHDQYKKKYKSTLRDRPF